MALSDKLELLKAAGFDVPDNAVNFFKDKEYRDRGIAEVYKCRCGHLYESPIPLTHYEHGCGKTAKRKWPRP